MLWRDNMFYYRRTCSTTAYAVACVEQQEQQMGYDRREAARVQETRHVAQEALGCLVLRCVVLDLTCHKL